ncbi:MAG: cation:proton antiporter [Alphaproteobacteria bacterium]|nr:cation:proton antiporter [Alphaproteobacteria bacterium]
MAHIPPLIIDLAIILAYAGIITLIFKWIKQPVVLGYVIAGIFAGPYFDFLPSVTDNDNITIWAEIGVIFLLFGLGLEFSFKKIVNVGKAAIITATTNILFMLIIGYNVGLLLGWTAIDSIFLGGMLSMSSTTIIIKAFEDLGLKKQKFTTLVFGVLVVEDVVGILLLVLLPTIALSKNVDQVQLLESSLKLFFFLALWFVVGIYLVPTFMKKIDRFLNDEMLLIVSVALCLGMVFLATTAGFSVALGAFIMGSILAESNVVERIEQVIKPVRDLFGAIFFVSVGMMVNPEMFVQYAGPILLITLIVIVGKVFFSCLGFMLSSQPLKTSIHCGFSLAQVGEFAFIIAALGMSIGVLSDFVYPIIVAVSVITTFTTPLMIKSADPVYDKINAILPKSWKEFLNRHTSSAPETRSEKSNWQRLFKMYFSRLFLFSIVLVGIMYISFTILQPIVQEKIPGLEGRIALTSITLLFMAPFLRALLLSRNNMPELFFTLWLEKKTNRLPLIMLMSFRIVIAAFFVMVVVHQLLTIHSGVIIALVLLTLVVLSRSRWLFSQYMKIETQFLMNLNRKQVEHQQETMNSSDSRVADDEEWLDSSLVVAQFRVTDNSECAEKLLSELLFREHYAINVFKIIRDRHYIDVPRGVEKISAGDVLLVVGTEKQMRRFKIAMTPKGVVEEAIADTEDYVISLREYILNQEKYSGRNDAILLCCAIPVEEASSLAGNSINASDIRGKTKSLVVGVERKSSLFVNPEISFVFKEGDLIWMVGEQKVISQDVCREMLLQSKSA